MSDLEYMMLAFEEAKKALDYDEVPIGAIIVKDGEVISKAYNLKETSQLVTRHAEIIAIEDAEKKLGTWYLDGCVLYTTLEPCLMCSGAIVQSRIQKVVYGAKEKRWSSLTNLLKSEELNHYPEVIGDVYKDECSSIISSYFKRKRSK